MRPRVQMQLCNLLSITPPDDIVESMDEAKFQWLSSKLQRREPLSPGMVNAARWYVKDQLESLTLAEKRTVLKENHQAVTGGELVLLERIADMMLFGALRKCAVCRDGDLSFSESENVYKCHGFSSAWAKCDFQVSGFYSLDRDPFRAPPNLCGFLDAWSLEYGVGAWLGREDEYSRAQHVVKSMVAAARQQTAPAQQENAPNAQRSDEAATMKQVAQVAASRMTDAQLMARWRAFLLSEEADESGVLAGEASGVLRSRRKWLRAPAVDKTARVGDAFRVAQCGAADYWHARLVKVDLTKNRNAFYTLQVLRSGAQFVLFTHWGRLGTTIGNHKLDRLGSERDATALFEEKFLEKTGNQWAARTEFIKFAGKMHLIDDSLDVGGDESDEHAADDNEAERSRLPPALVELLSLLFDRRNARRMLLAMQFDASKMPLDRLYGSTLDAAFGVLVKLEATLSSALPSRAQITALSTHFYTLLPHITDAVTPLPMLDTVELVRAKIRLLETLRELMQLQAVLKVRGTPQQCALDARYDALGCKLQPLARAQHAPLYTAIESSMRSAAARIKARIKLRHVYAVTRPGEADLYAAERAHKRDGEDEALLFHGSRLLNFVGILSQGLRCAPPNAPSSGYMFGKGIYHADAFCKSAEYCHASKDLPMALMLINRVALGRSLELKRGKYMEPSELAMLNCESVKGVGNKEPTDTLQGIPIGPMAKRHNDCELEYNEFIVFQPSQVKMEYLCLLEFEY